MICLRTSAAVSLLRYSRATHVSGIVEMMSVQHCITSMFRTKRRKAKPVVTGVCQHWQSHVKQSQVVTFGELIGFWAVSCGWHRLNTALLIVLLQLPRLVFPTTVMPHALHSMVRLRFAPDDLLANFCRGVAFALQQGHTCTPGCLVHNSGKVESQLQLTQIHM
jgi:hypothetical protein